MHFAFQRFVPALDFPDMRMNFKVTGYELRFIVKNDPRLRFRVFFQSLRYRQETRHFWLPPLPAPNRIWPPPLSIRIFSPPSAALHVPAELELPDRGVAWRH